MAWEVEFLETALRDLEEIAEYIAQNDPDAAARVVRKLVEAGEFKANLELARRLGVLKGSHLEVALDTTPTPMLGRGALKDTCDLIADGIRKLAGALAAMDAVSAEEWAKSPDLARAGVPAFVGAERLQKHLESHRARPMATPARGDLLALGLAAFCAVCLPGQSVPFQRATL